MKSMIVRRTFALPILLVLLLGDTSPVMLSGFAQSRRQPPSSPQKKNKRPDDDSPKSSEPKEELPPDIVNTPQDAEIVRVTAAVVNVEAVVYDKKSGQIITGLKKENFAIFEDGVKKEITNFSTPEAPITVAMVLEYSKLTNYLGGDRFEPGIYEVLRPMALFLSQFIKPPDDFVSVVAYDMRPTPITDFTNDPARINQVINLLLRNNPAFSEANLFDALKFVLVGGRGDSVVSGKHQRARRPSMPGWRAFRAVAGGDSGRSGIDTFSKINYGDARKIAQNAGVPIYIIGTGNLFFKKYERPARRDRQPDGASPGRLTILQAQNTLQHLRQRDGRHVLPDHLRGRVAGALHRSTR